MPIELINHIAKITTCRPAMSPMRKSLQRLTCLRPELHSPFRSSAGLAAPLVLARRAVARSNRCHVHNSPLASHWSSLHPGGCSSSRSRCRTLSCKVALRGLKNCSSNTSATATTTLQKRSSWEQHLLDCAAQTWRLSRSQDFRARSQALEQTAVVSSLKSLKSLVYVVQTKEHPHVPDQP